MRISFQVGISTLKPDSFRTKTGQSKEQKGLLEQRLIEKETLAPQIWIFEKQSALEQSPKKRKNSILIENKNLFQRNLFRTK
jgi:hypothetical protein